VAVATALMVGVCLCMQELLISAHLGPVVRLALVILTGVLVYGGASWVVNPSAIRELHSLRPRRSADTVVVAA
jgi:hypothetical protein